MKRFFNWLAGTQILNPVSARPARSFRPQIEQLDERLVPSALSSAITIYHPGSIYSLPWTERDWYATTQNGFVVEFQGTNETILPYASIHWGSGWTDFYAITALSASIDPNTGHGEVFGIGNSDPNNDPVPRLFLYDSSGQFHWLGSGYSALSATRDGHVYALTSDASDVRYLDSSGNVTDLGAPQTANGTGILAGFGSLAASVGLYGNEVFAIGRDGCIYVNQTNTPGAWQLVNSQAQFVSLSAATTNTFFAVTRDGRVFEETYAFRWLGNYGYYYWDGWDISGGMQWTQISADTDASGRAEVYAVEANNSLYLYDQSSWAQKDSDVYDIAAAGSGYFYDINYDGGNHSAWLYNPNNGWAYLGSGDFYDGADLGHIQ